MGLGLGAQRELPRRSSVTPGGPADQAGIKAGDRLVSIDGKRITAADLPGIVNRVRGPEGTQVRLGVVTGDAPVRQLTLTRRELTEPPVLSRLETRRRQEGRLRAPAAVRPGVRLRAAARP